jgi:hypothetical protein
MEEQEDDAEFLDRGIDRLARLGDALQKLGAGATLIGIPPERIASLVVFLLGEVGSAGTLILEEKEDPIIDEGGENEDEQQSGSGRGVPGTDARNTGKAASR